MATRNLRPQAPTDRRTASGFTLVEALVVAVIIGILSAVAIPMYSGYIASQRQKAVTAVAQTAVVTATSLFRRNNALPSSGQLNAALFLPDPSAYTITVEAIAGKNYVKVVDAVDPTCVSLVEIK